MSLRAARHIRASTEPARFSPSKAGHLVKVIAVLENHETTRGRKRVSLWMTC